MKHLLITVIGNVATGKSTLIERITSDPHWVELPADNFFTRSPFMSLEMQDRARWSLTGDLWFMLERVKLAKKIPEMLKKSHVIVDSGLPMNMAYAYSRYINGFYTTAEWQLCRELHQEYEAQLLPSTAVVSLHAPTSFLLDRIKTRGRDFEIKNYTAEYLDGIEKGVREVEKDLSRMGQRVISVHVDREDFISDERVLPRLLKMIRE